jgi:glycine oxidase
MSASYDFVIVGAGINGLLLARNLSNAGARVLLLDKSGPGQESSWAGGGIISPLYPWRYPAAITALASWAQDYYPGLAEALAAETGIDVQCRASGLLMLDADDSDEAIVWAEHFGRQVEQLGKQEIYQREAGLAAGFEAGLWMPQIANIRNPRLCRALLESLRLSKRVEIKSHCQLLGFESKAGRLTALRAACDLKLAAPGVIITAGAWSGRVAAAAGLQIDVHPVKGQMLLYKFPAPPIASIVLTAGRYLIPRADGHLLVGSTLEYAGFDKQASRQASDSLQDSARAMLPMLANNKPVGQWAGLRPGSGDGIPLIGRLPGFDNLYINAGQFRNGLVLAPASAELMKNLLLGEAPIVDPWPYEPGRESVRV